MSLVVAMKSIQQKHRYCQNYYSLFFVVQLQCVIVLFSFYILYSLRLRTVVSGFISSQETDLGCKSMINSDNIQMFLCFFICNHSIFRHDNFIGCFSADKIKMPARKYFCFNIPVYKNMVEESSCRSPYHEEYIRTGASGNPEGLCH